jgi:hypothetical protein
MGLITTAEAAAWLNIADWATDAPELPALVEAASAAVEEFCDRRFASATVTETYAGHGSRLIFPRRAPVTGVTSITVDDVAFPTFTFDDTSIKGGTAFPPSSVIVVTYTGGYATIPDVIQLATKMVVQGMYTAPAMDPNLTSESLGGVFSGGYAENGPGGIGRAARILLQSYVCRFVQL